MSGTDPRLSWATAAALSGVGGDREAQRSTSRELLPGV